MFDLIKSMHVAIQYTCTCIFYFRKLFDKDIPVAIFRFKKKVFCSIFYNREDSVYNVYVFVCGSKEPGTRGILIAAT